MGDIRRRYSDSEKALALACLEACGGNVCRASEATGIPRITLTAWRDGKGTPEPVKLQVEEAREALDVRLEQLANLILDKAMDTAEGCKLDQATFAQMMTGFGIAIDKMRLLREQATNITQNLSDDERRARITDLIDTARVRSSAAASDANGTAGTGSTPLH